MEGVLGVKNRRLAAAARGLQRAPAAVLAYRLLTHLAGALPDSRPTLHEALDVSLDIQVVRGGSFGADNQRSSLRAQAFA